MEEDKGKIFFYNINNQRFNFSQLISAIIFYIQENSQCVYKITVGSDSKAEKETKIITAVAVLRVGNGGRYFYTRFKPQLFYSLKERIYQETIASATLAQELRSRLKEKLGEDFFWNNQISVHIDVGENGPTKELIESTTGMVRGYGFIPEIKPNAFTASVVADRHA